MDEGWRLHADPGLTVTWTPAELGSVLVHHVSHLLRAHGERAMAAGITPDDARAWVRGADAEINDDLVPAGLDLPGRPVLPGHLGAEEGLLAEQYFTAGRGGAGTQAAAGLGPGLRQRRGRLGTGLGPLRATRAVTLAGPAAVPPGGAGLCPARAGSRERARRAAALGGADPAARRGLAAGARRGTAPGRGRHGRRGGLLLPAPVAARLGGRLVVLPALRRPVPEVAVVCDTSGSMTEDLLAAALAEVEGLLRSLGMARQVRVLACDTAVGPARRVTSARQVELVGGGGTDMGAGIKAAAALRPRPAVAVVLTDGFTPWPDRPPRGTRVVVALLGDEAPDGPPWARSVRVPSAAA